MTAGPDVLAAGGVVWREIDGVDHVGVIVRRRYGGDVSLPKGKLERGETLRACAVREVEEELGVAVETDAFLGAMTYRIGAPGREADKYVLFWEMRWTADLDDGPDGDEVDERRWMPVADALAVLTYPLERDLVLAAVSRRTR